MSNKQEIKAIKVTFKNNESESKLYRDIITECEKQLLSKAVWMKRAAKEKLEKSAQAASEQSRVGDINTQGFNLQSDGNKINSIDDLF